MLLIEDFFHNVQRPSRYIGNETNIARKDPESVDVRFCFVFPDVYEIGMSHTGMQILYNVLNSRQDTYCERAFTPWPDMADMLRQHDTPLFSLETETPLYEFDIVGFTLPHELCYTNILETLRLSNIPLLSSERDRDMPVLIAGGSVAFNPEPVAGIFDAIVLGDGEEVIETIVEIYKKWRVTGKDKSNLLKNLSAVEGIYIPSFFQPVYENGSFKELKPLLANYIKINKRCISDMDKLACPTRPIVPNTELVHDRLSVEIARGCTAGCRFCQAGMTYRPVRERNPQKLYETICESLEASGFEDVSLLSLSTGDYTNLDNLLDALTPLCQRDNITVSLPSLRVDALRPQRIEKIRKLGKTGLTLAPEAGTRRLRAVINKGGTEEELLNSVKLAFAAGWNRLKLYFMIGLPTETDRDIEGIAELCRKAYSAGQSVSKKVNITCSVSTFVPKAHTPFQWERQIRPEESIEKINTLKRHLRKSRVQLKWHNPQLSFLEGVFSRGDRKLLQVIISANKKGARFDSWTEHHNSEYWNEAFKESKVAPEDYLEARNIETSLPWNHLSAGIDIDFLRMEREKAYREERTEDCRIQGCHRCGPCDLDEGEKPGEFLREIIPITAQQRKPKRYRNITFRYRLTYTKTGRMAFLGHLELKRILERSFRRAEMPLHYSSGFNPEPKISYSSPVPMGVESTAEILDLYLVESVDPDKLAESINAQLPEGIVIYNAQLISPKEPSITASVEKIKWRFDPASTGLTFETEILRKKIDNFMASENIPFTKVRKGKVRHVNMRDFVDSIELREDGTVELTANVLKELQVRASQIAQVLLEIPDEHMANLRIKKIRNIFRQSCL